MSEKSRAPGEPPKTEEPKVQVGPSIAARRIPSTRATDKYGAVTPPTSVAPPPAIDPEVLARPSKPDGYVFPTRDGGEVEEASSSKATSLELTAVPSSVLARANLPVTERMERVKPPRPAWVSWAVGIVVVVGLAVVLAFVMR